MREKNLHQQTQLIYDYLAILEELSKIGIVSENIYTIISSIE
jgi:hypothetical protein